MSTITAPTGASSETVSFIADPYLLILFIEGQAGGLGKAVLEGAMNSIDAGASLCEITLTQTQLIISDNGKGMRSREEVDLNFARMGRQHAEDEEGYSTDAKYGKFRLGRGQLFVFGVNTWRTGPLQMLVDFRTAKREKKMAFTCSDGLEESPGCSITIDLYDRLSARELYDMTEEITHLVKYMPQVITLNGKQINTPPVTCKWSEETDDAYIFITERHTRGVELYQQGAYVMTIPSFRAGGVSGTIVTKQQIKLNVARNDVMSTDLRYKRIIGKFRKDVEEVARKKKDLSPAERDAILGAIRSGEQAWHNNLSAKVLTDVSGVAWSVNMLRRLLGQDKFITRPDGRIGFSFGRLRDEHVDDVMQAKTGLVFETSVLRALGNAKEEFMEKIEWRLARDFQYVELKDLAEGASSSHQLLDEDSLTGVETSVLSALDYARDWICSAQAALAGERMHWGAPRRKLRVGISGTAEGWTDGETYVAFSRDYIAKAGTAWGFVDLVGLLVHELCHFEVDTAMHEHSPEFYQRCHDVQSGRGPIYGQMIAQTYAKYMEIADKAVTKMQAKPWKKHAAMQAAHDQNEAALAASTAS